MSTNIATKTSSMEGGEEVEAVNAFMGCREEIEQMKGELAAKIVGLESILSRLASLEETVFRATQDRGEQSQALSDENQRLLARNEYLEAELRKQKEVVAAYQSSTEHRVSHSQQMSSCPQLPSLLGSINDEAEDGEPEESAAPTNTSNEQGEESLIPSLQSKCTSKRERESSLEQDPSRKEVVKKKQYRTKCSADGCTNHAQKGGVCYRHGAKKKRYECTTEGCTKYAKYGGVCVGHGAKIKLCSSDGCTNRAVKGGVCRRHGGKRKIYNCSVEGCTNIVKKGGVCVRHGAKKKVCNSEGCTNQAYAGGVCRRHGARVDRCSKAGCTNHAKCGGVCVRHGAKRYRCSSEGCLKQARRGGVCARHGAYRNRQDESTAFGSEFEKTTASQAPTNQRDSGAIPIGSGSVPGEVTILCQQVAEV